MMMKNISCLANFLLTFRTELDTQTSQYAFVDTHMDSVHLINNHNIYIYTYLIIVIRKPIGSHMLPHIGCGLQILKSNKNVHTVELFRACFLNLLTYHVHYMIKYSTSVTYSSFKALYQTMYQYLGWMWKKKKSWFFSIQKKHGRTTG